MNAAPTHLSNTGRRIAVSFCIILLVIAFGTGAYMILEDLTLFDAAYQTIVVVSTLGIHDSTSRTAGRIVTFILVIVGIGAVTFAVSTIFSAVVEGKLRTILGRRRVDAKIARLKGHYIICGYGRMGQEVCNRLAKQGKMVVVVEQASSITEQVQADGYLYVLGNAYEEETLSAAGITSAAGLVTVLPSDADNVFVALTAHELKSDMHIVSRAENAASVQKLRRAGATRIIMPHAIGARRIAASLLAPTFSEFMDAAFEDETFETGELIIPPHSPLAGKRLAEAHIRDHAEALVITVVKHDGTRIFNPSGSLVVQPGDELLFIGTRGTRDRVKALVSPTGD